MPVVSGVWVVAEPELISRCRQALENFGLPIKIITSAEPAPDEVQVILVSTPYLQQLYAQRQEYVQDRPVLLLLESWRHALPTGKVNVMDVVPTYPEALEHLLPYRVRQALQWMALHQQIRASRALLQQIRQQLSTITHDFNNPIAIISGNAQLLLEVGRMMNLEAELIRFAADIEEASRRLASGLHPVEQLKAQIDAFLRELSE